MGNWLHGENVELKAKIRGRRALGFFIRGKEMVNLQFRASQEAVSALHMFFRE